MRPATAAPRVVFLNRFYWPDVAATAQMLTDLAEDLAAQGWAVTVITSDTPYEGGASATLPGEEVRNGVRVLRVGGTRFGRHALGGRVADYASYMCGALIRLLRLPRHDMVAAMSDPPFIVGIALVAARLRGWRCVYWVQDLFPQIAAELGMLSPRSLPYRIARRLAARLNRSVDLVVALGPRMAARMVDAGARPERVAFVHNWADASAVRPVPHHENPFRREHGLQDKFVVLYSGNAGRPHRFEGVMEAARLLAADPGIVFLFIGGGKRTPALRREAEEGGLQNVRFLGYLPRESLAWSLTAADVSLVTEDPAMVGLLVPSKTYGILASGRPIVFMGDAGSDVADVVRTSGSGFVLDPTDGPGLRDVIERLREAPELAARLGQDARMAAVTTYDRSVATARWAERVRHELAP